MPVARPPLDNCRSDHFLLAFCKRSGLIFSTTLFLTQLIMSMIAQFFQKNLRFGPYLVIEENTPLLIILHQASVHPHPMMRALPVFT